MDSFKFIHAADLHLGTPLENSYNIPTRLANIVQNATYQALEKICDLAILHQVDFVLFSGDVFDQEARSIKAEKFLKKQVERLNEQNINLFMIAGNHDPVGDENSSSLEEYSNVWYFDSEKVEQKQITANNEAPVRIIGQSYRSRADSRKMVNYFTPAGEGGFNIGMLHTQLDPNNKNYVPCSIEDLKSKKGIDYWALGHIHKSEILSKSQPVIIFPGTPQGRHIGENGSKGCFLVTVENNNVSYINFLPTSPVIWLEKEVSIDGSIENVPENITELEDYIADEIEKILENNTFDDDIKGYMIRWIITGKTSLHVELEEQEDEARDILLDNLRRRFEHHSPFVWSDSIQFRTAKPLPSLEELKKQSDIFEYIDELTKKFLTDPELQKKISKELGAIWEWQKDHESYNEKKLQLNEENFVALVEQAKELAVEKLLERREQD